MLELRYLSFKKGAIVGLSGEVKLGEPFHSQFGLKLGRLFCCSQTTKTPGKMKVWDATIFFKLDKAGWAG